MNKKDLHSLARPLLCLGVGMKETMTHFVVQRVSEETADNQQSANPTVLSCGGMYLPRTKQNASLKRLEYNVLTLANQKEPVKVFTGTRPINPLHTILNKEILN